MPDFSLLAACSIRFSGWYLDHGRHIICGRGISPSMCAKNVGAELRMHLMFNEMKHILNLNLVRETPGQEKSCLLNLQGSFHFSTIRIFNMRGGRAI